LSLSSEIRAGLADIAAPALAAVPIGLLFGALATSKGLSPAEVFLMSAMVFAGGAQFAAIEQWVTPAPIAALALGTLLINSRHVLMGTSLAQKMGAFSAAQRFLGFFAMADENWALSERRAALTRLTPAYFFAMLVPFYVNWIGWSTLGALLGPMMGDPARFGADFAFTSLFIGLIAGFWKGRVTAATIAASGIVAALVKVTAGAPWHVPAGALAGVAAAVLMAEPDTETVTA
jgi:4-azaleucine resistance transporter AzlC